MQQKCKNKYGGINMRDLQKAQAYLHKPEKSLKEIADESGIKYQTLRRYSTDISPLSGANAKTISALADLWDSNPTYNLITEPWIKVLNKNYEERLVSLEQLFKNANDYLMLANDMHIQDISILRLAIAILITVYSRFDPKGESYPWITTQRTTRKISNFKADKVEPSKLLDTWEQVFNNKEFSKILFDYLKANEAQFDLFGVTPFYQVNATIYDENVPDKKKIVTGKGTVALKQINRRISESDNGPAIFSPRSDDYKNKLELDELARWLLTYQNYTGVTEKTKVVSDSKFTISTGWLYTLNPVFVKGKNLFETLMLNTILVSNNPNQPQIPYWEYSTQDYISHRLKLDHPTSVVEAYTLWSRMLCIKMDEYDKPILFSAGLPKLNNHNAFAELMTTWRYGKQNKDFIPDRKIQSTSKAPMWQDWDKFTAISDDNTHALGTVTWLKELYELGILSKDKIINLESIDLVDDGNPTSKLPAEELAKDLHVPTKVLIENANFNYVKSIVDITNKLVSNLWNFVKNYNDISGLYNKPIKSTEELWQAFNMADYTFDDLLEELNNEANKKDATEKWLHTVAIECNKIVARYVNESSPKARKGNGEQNIFTIRNSFASNQHRAISAFMKHL